MEREFTFKEAYKKIMQVGFDDCYQEGLPNEYRPMNMVAFSGIIGKKFYITKLFDEYYISSCNCYEDGKTEALRKGWSYNKFISLVDFYSYLDNIKTDILIETRMKNLMLFPKQYA